MQSLRRTLWQLLELPHNTLIGGNWGALLPSGLVPTERQLLAEAAVESPFGDRRNLVDTCRRKGTLLLIQSAFAVPQLRPFIPVSASTSSVIVDCSSRRAAHIPVKHAQLTL